MTMQLRGLWTKLQQQLAPAPPVTPAQLRDARPEVRWRAVRRLAGSRQSQHLPALFDLLADADPIIRDETVRTLASWGAEPSLSQARSLLASRPAPDMTVSLLDLLARLPDPGNQAAITPYLTAADPLVRAAAAAALGAPGTGGEARVLAPLLEDGDPRVRRAACAALGHIGDPAMLAPLASLQTDPDAMVRETAQRGMAVIEKADSARQARIRKTVPSGAVSPEQETPAASS